MDNYINIGTIAVIIFAVNIFRVIVKAKGGLSNLELNREAFFPTAQKQQALIVDELGKAIQKKDVTQMFNLFFEKKDINVNKVYNTGETPLILAVKTGDSTVVKILLDKGAYVNVQDKQGNSPLSLSKKLGHKDIEAFLEGALKRRKRLLAQE